MPGHCSSAPSWAMLALLLQSPVVRCCRAASDLPSSGGTGGPFSFFAEVCHGLLLPGLLLCSSGEHPILRLQHDDLWHPRDHDHQLCLPYADANCFTKVVPSFFLPSKTRNPMQQMRHTLRQQKTMFLGLVPRSQNSQRVAAAEGSTTWLLHAAALRRVSAHCWICWPGIGTYQALWLKSACQ